jgi:hypothetical protein
VEEIPMLERITQRALVMVAVLGLGFLPRAQAADWDVIERTLSGSAGVYGFGYLGSGPALEAFTLQYTDRDHFIRDIMLGPLAGPSVWNHNYVASMAGKFANERVMGGFTLRDFSSSVIEHRKVFATCTGEDCSIPISPVLRHQVFVLTGFHLNYGYGHDHQISVMKVAPQIVNGEVRSIRVGFGYWTGTSPFSVVVSYMQLPWQLFSYVSPWDPGYNVYRTWTNSNFTWEALGGRPYGVALVNGFELRFLNGVQNLLRVSIDLRSGPNGEGRVKVGYSGNAPGQPAFARVQYVLFQPRIL